MKVLVGPSKEQAGKGKLDFTHCGEMELLRIGRKCDSGHPKDECGCRRALTGISSDKGTTIAIIQELPIDEVIRLILECCPTAMSKSDKRREKQFNLVYEEVRLLSQYIQDDEEGKRICVEFPQKGSMDIREAGGILNRDYGI